MSESVPIVAAAPASLPARRPRWPWWVAGVLTGFLILGAVLYLGLDPWLRRQLEKQVAQQSGGRYSLRVGDLQTRLADGSVTLTGLRLRTVAAMSPRRDSLPRLAFDLPRLRLTGVGLWSLWRKQPQHLDSLALTGLRLQLDSLPTRAGPGSPLHRRLPARVPNLSPAHLVVRDARVTYAGRSGPLAACQRLDLRGRQIQLDSASAADTARLLYARAWTVQLRGAQGLVARHRGWVRALDLNTQAGRLTLDSLRVRPARAGRPAPSSLTLRVGRVRLTGLRVAALLRRRFRADSLRITDVYADLTTPAKPPPPVHQLLLPVFERLDLASLHLTNGYVRLRGIEHAPVVRDLDLRADSLRVDSTGYVAPRRVLYAAAWTVRTGPAMIPLDPPYYRVSYRSLALATRAGELRLTDARLQPTLPIGQMARRKGHEVTRMTVRVPLIHLAGADFGAFTRRKDVVVRAVTVTNPRVRIEGDARYRINPKPSIVTPEAIGRIPLRVDVRRVIVTGGLLDFWFIGTVSPHSGTMQVTRLAGSITNVSNDPARMSAAHPAVVRASAWLQDRCRVQATGWLNFLDPQGRHRLTGTFGPAPFALLNPVSEPATLMQFKNGQSERIDMDLRGDRTHVTGTMRARYHGMHVRLLTPDLDQSLFTKIKSKAANKLILHDNNPDKPGEALRVARIESRREPRFSVFALWKQGLVDGLLVSFGIPEKLAQRTSERKTEPGE